MSDLPVPAVLAILAVVLLVLVVLGVLVARGRRDDQGPVGTGATQGGTSAESSTRASAARPAETSSDGPTVSDASADPAGPSPSSAEATGVTPAGAVEEDPSASSDAAPVDDDPRPWRERHGRRASRPLLSERSEARTAEEELAPAQNWERPQDGEAELRR